MYHNRYKQYLLADSGYDSKENHNFLIKKGYTPIIIQNKRNIKNKNLIRKQNKKQIKICCEIRIFATQKSDSHKHLVYIFSF